MWGFAARLASPSRWQQRAGKVGERIDAPLATVVGPDFVQRMESTSVASGLVHGHNVMGGLNERDGGDSRCSLRTRYDGHKAPARGLVIQGCDTSFAAVQE